MVIKIPQNEELFGARKNKGGKIGSAISQRANRGSIDV